MSSTFPSPYEWSVIKHYEQEIEQEIRAIKPLDAREEKNIIASLERARAEGKKASPHQEIIRMGEKAQQRLVEVNLHLVVLQLKRMTWNTVSLTTKDLIQEGNIGLIQAARYYNPQTGYAFSTFAMQCIHNAVVTALKRKDRFIHIPEQDPRSSQKSVNRETRHDVTDILSYEIMADLIGEKADEYAEEEINSILDKIDFQAIASEVMKELDEQEKDLVVSIFLQGITQDAYQTQHGISEKTVRKAKKHIRQKAQQALERRGIKTSDLFR